MWLVVLVSTLVVLAGMVFALKVACRIVVETVDSIARVMERAGASAVSSVLPSGEVVQPVEAEAQTSMFDPLWDQWQSGSDEV